MTLIVRWLLYWDDHNTRSDCIVTDIYGQLDDDNETAIVDSILQKMLDKEVISKAVIRDLGVGDSQKQQVDPHTKMQMRHLQVAIAVCAYFLEEVNLTCVKT